MSRGGAARRGGERERFHLTADKRILGQFGFAARGLNKFVGPEKMRYPGLSVFA